MNKKLYVAVLISVSGATASALAYEVPTHEWMTGHAIDRSILGRDPSIVQSIGLENPASPLKGSDGSFATARQLMIAGVRLEDDGTRPRHHFFDPQHGGIGLTVPGVAGTPSPDWVLGQDPLNAFSFRAAHTFYYNALTSSRAQRANWYGLMFESLGRTMHHLQDMAQPEHTRNDPHLPFFSSTRSAYEKYTLEQSSRNPVPLPTEIAGYGAPLDLGVFDHAREFWAGAGAGMAEFTSNNFVSADTNFVLNPNFTVGTNPQFPAPAATACPGELLQNFRDIESPDLLGLLQPLRGPISFVGTPVRDEYLVPGPAGEGCNARTSSLSIFSSDLQSMGLSTTLSLNRFTFDAAHRLLLPRAIAFSSGIVDYFFRGRLRIEGTSVASGAVMLTLRNVSAGDIALADGAASSTEFEVWYDALDGTRKRAVVNLGSDIGGNPIGPSGIRAVRFEMPGDADPASRTPFMLLFRGQVGAEEGVIAQAFTLNPYGFVLTPNYTVSDGITGRRVIRSNGSGWTLSPETGVVAGNVDWRGWRAEDILTWMGPRGRYFGAGSRTGQIFYAGRVLALAPATQGVAGAAIGYEGGVRTLIIATSTEAPLALHLYSRPFQESYPNDALYDPVTNPLGWKPLLSSPLGAGFLRTPVFFNASGTEAQTILDTNERLKISVTNRTASRINARGKLVTVRSRQNTRSTTTGENDACGPSGTYNGSCIDLRNCSPGNPLCRVVDYDANYSVDIQRSWIDEVTLSEPSVVCVDYRGDTEVLCRFSYEMAGEHLVQSDRLDRESTYQRLSQCGPPVTSQYVGLGTSNGSSRSDITRPTMYRFEAGSIALKFGFEGIERMSLDHSIQGLVTLGGSGSVHYDYLSAQITYGLVILYLDIRHGSAVYMVNRHEFRNEGTGTVAINPANYTSEDDRVVLPGFIRQVRHHELIAELPDRIVAYEADFETSSPTTRSQSIFGAVTLLDLTEGASCADSSGNSSTDAPVTLLNAPMSQFVQDFIYGSDVISAAVDGAGHIAASMPIPIRQFSTGPFSHAGTWNFLSGGDLPTLLPGAPAQPRYSAIGVIR